MSGSTPHARSCPNCPWTGSGYGSEAIANSAQAKHSCEKARARQQSLQRRAERRAQIEATRVTVDCPHGGLHEHGTWQAYKSDACRCRPCTDAETAKRAHLHRQNAYGRGPMVDPGPAREHVRHLLASGMTVKSIVRASGLTSRVVSRLLYTMQIDGRTMPPTQSIRAENAAALLAITLDPTVSAYRPILGVQRRLQALVALGWHPNYIAARLGTTSKQVYFWITARRNRVRADIADRIVALYRDLSRAPAAPSTHLSRREIDRALARAHASDWVTPGAWSDIDDPLVTPTPGSRPSARGMVNQQAIERRQSGDVTARLTEADKRYLAVTWVDRGKTPDDLAAVTALPADEIVALLTAA